METPVVRIRPALVTDAAGIARVHVDTWRAAYQGIINAEILDGLSVEQRTQRWLGQLEAPAPKSFLLVAEQAGSVIGFASGGLERTDDPLYKGEIYGLYLRPENHRQGIGRRLVEAGVMTMLENGLPSMLIWVLRDNPSRWFYEAIGGQYVREQEVDIRGQMLWEVAYGWRNLNDWGQQHA